MIIERPKQVTGRLAYWPLREWMAVFRYTGEMPPRYWVSSWDRPPLSVARAEVPAILRALQEEADYIRRIDGFVAATEGMEGWDVK